MIRVLHIFHNMGNGGIENFVMNNYRYMDKTKIQFDFLTSVNEPGFFDNEILSLGGQLYHAYPFKKNPVQNYNDIKRIVKDNGYQIVHRHTGSAFGYLDLRAARSGGAKTLILHSHASSAGKKWIHKISKRFLAIPCERFACSDEAGEFLYGTGTSYTVINNAIEAEKYCFSNDVRQKVRGNHNAKGKIVLGHVGAFYSVKNHRFLIDILECLNKRNSNFVLWLVGDGQERKKIESIVKEKGLSESVLFWGNRKDVSDILQGMDYFVLPSFHEGFNIATVEAQCAGLKCFVSDSCAGLKQYIYLPLEKGAAYWAAEIEKSRPFDDRLCGYEFIKEAHFDIRDVAKELEERYIRYAES